MKHPVAALLAVATLLQGVAVILLGRLAWPQNLQIIAVTTALAGMIHQAWVHRLRLNHRVDMFLVMGVFGGLGMLAGWWIDLGFSAPPRDASFHAAMGHGCGGHATTGDSAPESTTASGSCCDTEPVEVTPEADCCGSDSGTSSDGDDNITGGGGGGGFWTMVFSWMTGLMLVGAIPPGLLWTRCAQLARSGWRRWVSTHIVGNALMVVAMVWVGHALGPILAAWMDSAVLGGHLGMLGGMLIGMEAGMFLGEAVLGLQPWREWRWGFDPMKDTLTP